MKLTVRISSSPCLELLDSCFNYASDLSEDEKASLYYMWISCLLEGIRDAYKYIYGIIIVFSKVTQRKKQIKADTKERKKLKLNS